MLGQVVMYDPLYAPAVMLVCGILLAFMGRRLVPLALVLASVAMGVIYGGSLMASLTDDPDAVTWGPVVFGAIFAIVSFILYRLAFFAAGALLGFVAAGMFFPDASFLAVCAAALAAGALVYFFRNFVFSVLTSILGGSLAATGSVNLLAWAGIFAGPVFYWIAALVVTLSGMVFQLRRRGGKR